MGESQHKQKRLQNKLMQGGMKGPGKLVEVQGGRILRSTGGKDRHSKVFTSKGPRDRRVRLSALTAIQFYDVQDRLGYDRPSKAVDWLINKAKAAIDELAELPTKNPHPPLAESSKRELQSSEDLSSSPFGFPSNGTLPTLDSDALADTIKSFFPISTSPAIGFQREEDLRLSLHSFQDPILLPGHSSANYDAGSSNWAEQSQRMIPWNIAADAAPLHPLPGQGSYFSQRGPLQSSFPANGRSWADAFSAVEQQSYTGAAFGGFSGFLIPARIQEEDDHGGVAGKPSSASSASRQ